MAVKFAEDDSSVQLNGTHAYVDRGNPSYLNFAGPITLQAWVKPSATTGLRNIVAPGYTQTPPAEVFLRINNGQYQAGSWNNADHVASAPIAYGILAGVDGLSYTAVAAFNIGRTADDIRTKG